MTLLVHLRRRRPHTRVGGRVAEAARLTLESCEVTQGEVTVVLTGDQEMRDLNRRYGGEDEVTDVLAFANGSRDPETRLPYFGDVVIAVPVAAEQASDAGHSLEDELALLTVHGVLHLLGHDHGDSAQRARMEPAQEGVLIRLGVGAHPPPETP